MALQTFTAGQVLTAVQVNALQANDYNQTVSTKVASYVLVAADKGTRVVMDSGSATTITVNTSLFSAGDTLFIQNIGAGVCTITAGTATVSTAGSLALPQNAGGTLYFTSAGVSIFFPTVAVSGSQGLTLIKSQVIGTTVSTVNVTGAFSATYDNYKIIISSGVTSTTANVSMQLGATATGYYAGVGGVVYSSGSFTGVSDNNAVAWTYAGYSSTSAISFNADLQNPFLSKNTIIFSQRSTATTGASGAYNSGFLNNTTSYTDFTLGLSTGTFTGGTIRVYGYNN
jgi:hypothetical protein